MVRGGEGHKVIDTEEARDTRRFQRGGKGPVVIDIENSIDTG